MLSCSIIVILSLLCVFVGFSSVAAMISVFDQAACMMINRFVFEELLEV